MPDIPGDCGGPPNALPAPVRGLALAFATLLLALPDGARAAGRSATLAVSVTVLAPAPRRPQAPASPQAKDQAAAPRLPPLGSIRLAGVDGVRETAR
jgi:hypothetical protein